jgi:RsiW-degrading membrane proteinase PrsW (M82 family)
MHLTQCPTCGTEVPLGVFCGACGHHLVLHEDGANNGFRAHSYAAAPGEHVLRLSIVSTLFPHLPHRSRAPFRVAVVVLIVGLVVLAALRLQAPMIAVAALGVPLVFQLYLQECDVYEDLPLKLLGVAALLGAALGYGWAALTDHRVTDATAGSLLGSGSAGDFWLDGVLIPAVGGLLLLVPAAVAFAMKPPHIDESLDGFLIGSLGAVAFTAASTITRLAPQLKTGIVAHGRPVESIVVEALLQGGTVPITAASIGGIVGAALWVRRRSQSGHLGRWLATARVMVPVAIVLYAVLGVIDYEQPPQATLLALHIAVAIAALLLLRYGLHAVLLHEEHEVQIGAPRVCPHCEQVVPAMPFCPHCGFAHRASSRAARARLELGPAAPAGVEEPSS